MADVKVALGTAHLSVLLARQAPIGLILRRGPIGWIQLVKWYTDMDVFEDGHWLEGDIKDESADLSPDGRLMIYKASKPDDWTKSGYTHEWTAISKPPYLTSLALWAVSDGGKFINNTTVFIMSLRLKPHPNHQPHGLDVRFINDPQDDFELIYEPEDYMDWQAVYYKVGHRTGFMKRRFPDQMIEKLYQHFPNQFTFYYTGRDDISYTLPSATWADIDQQGRLVYAKDGKLFSAKGESGKLISTELADFNGRKPKRIRTPEWASKW